MKGIEVKNGNKYGDLTIIKEIEQYILPGGQKMRQMMCLCNCGKKKVVKLNNLRRGKAKSCGCFRNRETRIRRTIHGESGGNKSKLYRAYINARTRCNNPNNKDYHYYGGRGIRFLFKDYCEFMAYIGKAPSPSHSIDRIDNDGHYAPGNVKWSTKKEQRANRRNENYTNQRPRRISIIKVN